MNTTTLSAGNAARRNVLAAIVVAALGYFVDIYDLILFGVVRDQSLRDLGLSTTAELTSQGIYLMNMQMGGMLLGGILWGVLGDKRGRLSVLFGSIVMYSLANLANGAVTSLEGYSWCRLLAGIGLAGELGAGVTLVAELMPAKSRGWGTTFIAFVGVLGCLLASVIGGGMPSIFEGVHWRTAYYIGGTLGLFLLLLRVGVVESGMFERVRHDASQRGDFLSLFAKPERLKRYAAVILVGVPIWYVIGILVLHGGAMATVHGTTVRTATALFYAYAGLAVGDMAAGAISQWLKSRRKAFTGFLIAMTLAVAIFFAWGLDSENAFYTCCFVVGVTAGYWAVFVTAAAEQFGTNLRATVATTAPNFVRGSLVPVSLAFEAMARKTSLQTSAIVVGMCCVGVALVAVRFLPETFGRELDFTEG